MSCTGSLSANPDISGIGVRLSFYIQAFFTMVLAYIPGASSDASYWSMTITAFALFASALALYGQDDLYLHEAILISILLYLHAYAAVLCVMPLFSDSDLHHGVLYTNAQLIVHFGRAMLRMMPVLLAATVFGLFVWTHAASFGPEPTCNVQTTLVLLGAHLEATRAGRTAALVFVGVNTYFIGGCAILCAVLAFKAHTSPNELLLPNSNPASQWTKAPAIGGPDIHARIAFSPTFKRFSLPLQYMLFVFLIAVFVINVELTIVANRPLLDDGAENNAWTLGQIFPVVMLGVPATSFVSYFRDASTARVRQRAREELERRPVVGVSSAEWHERLHLRLVY
ncbi:hypothetical protein OF83DRAFT_1174400 [Amylostereum chailletii]|nr:hypothetical protein OF83DRAFT_1174400 [Amylostereum chailletii]